MAIEYKIQYLGDETTKQVKGQPYPDKYYTQTIHQSLFPPDISLMPGSR